MDVELTAIEPTHAPGQVPAGDLWRTITMEPAGDSGDGPTRVDGLPVVQVQVQQAGTDQQITAVDQRLGSGEVIRLIDGPASQLADLMTAEMAPTQPGGPEAELVQQSATAMPQSPGGGGAGSSTSPGRRRCSAPDDAGEGMERGGGEEIAATHDSRQSIPMPPLHGRRLDVVAGPFLVEKFAGSARGRVRGSRVISARRGEIIGKSRANTP